MNLENFVWKKKIFSPPPLLHFGPWPFFPHGPLALPPLSLLGQPSRAPRPLGPASRVGPAFASNCYRSLGPSPSATAARATTTDSPAPPASTFPHLPQPPRAGHGRNHPRPLASTCSSEPRPLQKESLTRILPPRCLPVPISRPPVHEEASTAAPRSADRPSARTVVPESPSSSLFPAVSFSVLPSFLRCFQFCNSWPFGLVSRAPKKLSPPAMATSASAALSGRCDGLGEFPFSPDFSRCLRIFEPWPLAP